MANLITRAQADRVVTVDLHAEQIQGFFDIPVDHLSALPLLARYVVGKNLGDLTVASPDAGHAARARDMADRLGATFAIVEKHHPAPGVSQAMNILGDVRDRTVVLLDDMIDSGGSLLGAARLLMEVGARAVYACATHPIFSGDAVARLDQSPLGEVVVSDTIPVDLPPELRAENGGKFRVLTVAPLLAEAIARIHEDLSVSELFE